MKTFVKENTWLRRYSIMDFGWGNGYVCIPKGHPLYGLHYNKIHELMPNLEVNGGLTFSASAEELNNWDIPDGCEDTWVVGFDTAHSWDSLSNWPDAESVMRETERLREQLESYQLV